MRHLDRNWLTSGLIDLEYKKYIMMSYLQFVQGKFSVKMLYPLLDELVYHYRSLKELETEKQSIQQSFPKQISNIDVEEMKINYKKTVSDPDWISRLDEIIDLALASFVEKINFGNEIVEEIISSITIHPVGIVPIYKNDGYLFISSSKSKIIRIYKYLISPLKGIDHNEQIRIAQVGMKKRSIAISYLQIKKQLIRSDKKMPNPATYSIHCKEKIPFNAAYLPIAKNLLLDQIAA
ncbi:MAG: hypothetical protein MI975_00520 [Cytophagales bacterium]|nr:hypothetical protein [Cytophagales bacterium]